MMILPKLYMAGPLFSEAELEFNRKIRDLLSDFFEVYLPQEDGGLFVDMVAKGVAVEEASKSVFLMDLDKLESCNIFLIILDGRVIDEGAAFELGIAFAQGKACFGLRTDPRQLLATGNNPMIEAALKEVFVDTLSLLKWAQNYRGTWVGPSEVVDVI
jgi:nucleoside 2-deoxyribosyltransferase